MWKKCSLPIHLTETALEKIKNQTKKKVEPGSTFARMKCDVIWQSAMSANQIHASATFLVDYFEMLTPYFCCLTGDLSCWIVLKTAVKRCLKILQTNHSMTQTCLPGTYFKPLITCRSPIVAMPHFTTTNAGLSHAHARSTTMPFVLNS